MITRLNTDVTIGRYENIPNFPDTERKMGVHWAVLCQYLDTQKAYDNET